MLMTANEAREKMQRLIAEEDKKQLQIVEKNIECDLKRGYTHYYGELSDSVTNRLRELGYDLSYSSNLRDGDLTIIGWVSK